MSKVSVIVPCYNTEKYIGTCINSLVNQTLDDIEIIAVVAPCSDNTAQIVKQFEKEYPNKLKALYLQNCSGVSEARNFGLSVAQGKYIGFVDSDDVVALNMYQDLYQWLEKYQKSIITVTSANISNQEFLQNQTFTTFSGREPDIISYSGSPQAYYYETVACWDKLFSHDFLGNTKFLENHIFEDISFTRPLLLKAKETMEIMRGDYLYRENPTSIMHRNKEVNTKILDILDVCLDAIKRGEKYQLSQKEMQMLKDSLKCDLIRKLYTISNWDIKSSDKIFILERLHSIYAHYFPDLTNVEDETLQKRITYGLDAIGEYTPLKITDLEKENINVRQRILELEKKKEKCQK